VKQSSYSIATGGGPADLGRKKRQAVVPHGRMELDHFRSKSDRIMVSDSLIFMRSKV